MSSSAKGLKANENRALWPLLVLTSVSDWRTNSASRTSWPCVEYEPYEKLTNKIYEGLFGLNAVEMRQQWDLMAGSSRIARNHITEEKGLEAVKFCEDLVVRIFAGDIEEAHRDAFALTVRKYKLYPQRLP